VEGGGCRESSSDDVIPTLTLFAPFLFFLLLDCLTVRLLAVIACLVKTARIGLLGGLYFILF